MHQATADFTVEGKKYPSGSYIVKTNQAFRPHVLDMFEPQDHPNDFKYPGGPPVAPYDAAGWTLAYLMNVKFDRILNDFSGPFKKLPIGELLKPKAPALATGKGYILSAKQNDSYLAVNELLKSGVEVLRSQEDGSFYIAAASKAVLDRLVSNYGLKVTAGSKPKKAIKVKPSRIALWDVYGGSMDSGWIRFIMEQYHYNAQVIFAPEIDAGKLKEKYDVIVFVDGSIPAYTASPATNTRNFGTPENLPDEYKNKVGRVSQLNSIPQLKAFLNEGGKVVAIGSATNLAGQLELPLKNALVENVKGEEKRLSQEKYYVPGSVLSVMIDEKNPANFGLDTQTDVYFDNSPVFKLDSASKSSMKIKPLAWFPNATPLRSGWAWGQSYLKDGIAAFEADYGKGKLYAFGPEITFRAQTHGTFKWLFNQLYQ